MPKDTTQSAPVLLTPMEAYDNVVALFEDVIPVINEMIKESIKAQDSPKAWVSNIKKRLKKNNPERYPDHKVIVLNVEVILNFYAEKWKAILTHDGFQDYFSFKRLDGFI